MRKPLHFLLAAKFVFLLNQILSEIGVPCTAQYVMKETATSITTLTLDEEAFSLSSSLLMFYANMQGKFII